MSAAVKESVPENMPSNRDECSTLAEGFLGTIAKMTGAIAGAVRVLSDDGKEMHLIGSFGLEEEVVECESTTDSSCGACGAALRELEARFAGVKTCMLRNGRNFFGKGCKSMVAVPLVAKSKTIGIFNLFFSSPKTIPEETEKNLYFLGELLAIALDNSRRARESRRAGIVTERRCMANEIHDSLAQNLVFARMRMSLLNEAIRSHNDELAGKYVNDVTEALSSGQRAVRELITHFRSPMDPLGLEHALRELVEEFKKRSGIPLEFSNRVAEFDLPVEYELQAFNIVREVLANIAAHSSASCARLAVCRNAEQFVFVVEDNGSGIPDSAPGEGHYGLTIMRERAMKMGGTLEVESACGKGTKVKLSIPCSPEKLS